MCISEENWPTPFYGLGSLLPCPAGMELAGAAFPSLHWCPHELCSSCGRIRNRIPGGGSVLPRRGHDYTTTSVGNTFVGQGCEKYTPLTDKSAHVDSAVSVGERLPRPGWGS